MNYSEQGSIGGASLGQTRNYQPMPTPDIAPNRLGQALDSQSESLANLHSAIKDLEARLQVVMRPEPPANESKGGIPPAPLSGSFTAKVSSHARETMNAAIRLRELIDRLDV